MSDMKKNNPSGFVNYHDLKVLVHQLMAEMSEMINNNTLAKIDQDADLNLLPNAGAVKEYIKTYIDNINLSMQDKIEKIENINILIDQVDEKINNFPVITPISETFITSLFASPATIDPIDPPPVVLEPPSIMISNHPYSYNTFFEANGKDSIILRKQVRSITTFNNTNISADAEYAWDISRNGDGSVMAWYTPADGKTIDELPFKHLCIGGMNGIDFGPTDDGLMYIFASFNNMMSCNLSAFRLSDKIVYNTSGMFKECESLTTVDLSSFNITIAEFVEMFYNTTNLKFVDMRNIKFHDVGNVSGVFTGSGLITYPGDIFVSTTAAKTRLESLTPKPDSVTVL